MTGRARHRRGLRHAAVRSSAAFGLLLLLAWGCGDSTSERIAAKKLAGGCTLNSDCDDDLVCVFERCHDPCHEDEDCPLEQRCVKGEDENEDEGDGNAGEAYVCQLPDETHCVGEDDCKGDQVCGIDGECRDECNRDADCTSGQTCANSNECASRSSERDRLDEEGNVLRDAFGVGGRHATGGSSGSGATSGAGGTSGAGATGGAGAIGGAGGTIGTGGADGTSGDGGSGDPGGAGMGGQIDPPSGGAGAGGDGGRGSGGEGGEDWDYEEPSDGTEPLANGSPDTPVRIESSASIYLAERDSIRPEVDNDWFAFTVPDNGPAHIITVNVDLDVGVGSIFSALSGVDHELLGSALLSAGTTTNHYLTVGSGTTTLIGLRHANSAGRAVVRVSAVEEQDAHEPNNSFDAVAGRDPLPLGENIAAQFVVPFVSAAGGIADDWYPLDLAAGQVTVTMLQSPANVAFRLSIERSDRVPRAFAGLGAGELNPRSLTITTPGRHFLRFHVSGAPVVHSRDIKPEHMAKQYIFRVTQP